jgi:hypothetical protein
MQNLFEELKNGVAADHHLLGIESSLDYLAECRHWIHLICEKVFPDKGVTLFGRRRNSILITPMGGRYGRIVNLKKCIKAKESDTRLSEPLDRLQKSKPIYRQIVYEGMPLTCMYWEKNTSLIDSIKPSDDIISNPLLYRCLFHTDPIYHDVLISMIDCKNLKKSYWILCQATLYFRGSASITEMFISAISGKLLDVKFGLDVPALTMDYEEFDEKFELKFIENKYMPLRLEDLKKIYSKIHKGCIDIRQLLKPEAPSCELLEEIDI